MPPGHALRVQSLLQPEVQCLTGKLLSWLVRLSLKSVPSLHRREKVPQHVESDGCSVVGASLHSCILGLRNLTV